MNAARSLATSATRNGGHSPPYENPMKFKADEIASVLQAEIEQYESRIDVREVGRFPSGVIGLAFNLEENSVGVIILGDYLAINEGDEVRSTGQLLSVPVGEAVIGRVVDPLGNPIDGKGPIVSSERRPVEVIA